jgi:hypothetical protein
MPSRRITVLNEPVVRDALKQAWQDSQPGPTGGHEVGGFILRNEAGKKSVMRWPRGGTDFILMAPYVDCRIGDSEIIATFHTHPNTGADYLQEPGEADRRAVRDDPDLKGVGYVSHFATGDLPHSSEWRNQRGGGYHGDNLSRRRLAMAATLTPDVLEDQLAVSLARVLAAANKQARGSGVDAAENFITITQRSVNGGLIWRVNYSARDVVGRRGGDLIVDVDGSDGTIKQVLRGQ